MPVKMRIPTPLQKFTAQKAEVDLEGRNVTQLLEALERQCPGIAEKILDEKHQLRRFVNIFVNGEDIRFLQGLNTPVQNQDEVSIIPAIAGG